MKDNYGKALEIFCYLVLGFNFIGSDFLKFNIFGINMTIGRILMAISAILLFIIICKRRKYFITNENNKTVNFLFKFLIGWSIFSLISFFISKDIMSTVIYEFFILVGTINILLMSYILKEDRMFYNIFRIIEVVAIANLIYSLILYYTTEGPYGAFYFNVNDLATFFLLAIPVEIALIIKKTQKNISIILRIAILLMELYVFYLLDSRACKLGAMMGIICIIGIVVYKRFLQKKSILEKLKAKKKIMIPLTIIMCVIIAIVGISIVKKNFVPKYDKLSSNSIRVNLIYNGLFFLKDHFILGIGAGNMGYFLEHNAIYPTKNILNMHNYWMEILVDFGVIIFIFFVISYFKLIKTMLSQYNHCKDRGRSSIYLVFLFFLFSFIIGSISSSNNITREWVWLAFGIFISYINILPGKIHDKEKIEKGSKDGKI